MEYKELEIIYNVFKQYFDEKEITYKGIIFKYRIEIFTADLTIVIKIDSENDIEYVFITVRNDINMKFARNKINLENEKEIELFNFNDINNLLSEVD